MNDTCCCARTLWCGARCRAHAAHHGRCARGCRRSPCLEDGAGGHWAPGAVPPQWRKGAAARAGIHAIPNARRPEPVHLRRLRQRCAVGTRVAHSRAHTSALLGTRRRHKQGARTPARGGTRRGHARARELARDRVRAAPLAPRPRSPNVPSRYSRCNRLGRASEAAASLRSRCSASRERSGARIAADAALLRCLHAGARASGIWALVAAPAPFQQRNTRRFAACALPTFRGLHSDAPVPAQRRHGGLARHPDHSVPRGRCG